MSELDNVYHLKARAAADLAQPYTGVSLDWAMRVAHFAGKLEETRVRLGFTEHCFRDAKSAFSSRFAPDAADPRTADMLRELADLQSLLASLRGQLGEWTELLRAAELTSALIERRLFTMARTTKLRVIEGGSANATALEGNSNG